MDRCSICGKDYQNLEGHLSTDHLIDTWTYRRILDSGTQRKPGFIGWPGINDPKVILGDIIEDPLLQLMVASTDLLGYTLGYSFIEGRKVLQDYTPPGSSAYFGASFRPGFPRELSGRNHGSLDVIPVELGETGNPGEFRLARETYRVIPPEICAYDSRHHSRYNILKGDSEGTRRSRRIRIAGTGKCYKFYNSSGDSKTIFRVLRSGNPIKPGDLTWLELLFIKQYILREVPEFREIYQELLKIRGTFRDQVILRDTLHTGVSGRDPLINLSWTPDGGSPGINISVL